MVFNDFILSLELDPAIFNPFAASPEVQKTSDYPEEEGDPYTLVDDIPIYPSCYSKSKNEIVVSKPVTHPSVDVISEEVDEVQKCQSCIHRQRSLDPYDSSSAYICTIDGSKLPCRRKDVDDCIDYEESIPLDDEDDPV